MNNNVSLLNVVLVMVSLRCVLMLHSQSLLTSTDMTVGICHYFNVCDDMSS